MVFGRASPILFGPGFPNGKEPTPASETISGSFAGEKGTSTHLRNRRTSTKMGNCFSASAIFQLSSEVVEKSPLLWNDKYPSGVQHC